MTNDEQRAEFDDATSRAKLAVGDLRGASALVMRVDDDAAVDILVGHFQAATAAADKRVNEAERALKVAQTCNVEYAADLKRADERVEAMPCYRLWQLTDPGGPKLINVTACVDRPDPCPRCAAIRARGGSGT